MDLLQPRRVYQRANSDDPQAQDAFEMMSISSRHNDQKSDLWVDEGTSSLKNPASTYSNDYHWRSPDHDQVALLQPAKRATWLAGWRTGAYSAAGIAFISLLVNVGAAIWLKRHPNASDNLVQILHGSCDAITRMDIWVHLLINAISTLLLGGSNYCMQCLCAPNRQEIDQAHAKGRYVDIGVPSFHNLQYIAPQRVVLWWILALSSLPLHLMYNSAFYSSLATNDYEIFFVTPDFLNGGNATFSYPAYNSEVLQLQSTTLQTQIASNDTNRFERLDHLGCIKAYAQVLLADHRNLVFVLKNDTMRQNSTVIAAEQYFFENAVSPTSQTYEPFDWICTSDPDMQYKIKVPVKPSTQTTAPCDTYVQEVENIANQWNPYGYQIDYCLAEVIEENCSFNGNLPIITVVIIANTIKLIVMLIVAYHLAGNPLITIGDAVESFLDVPDETTRNMCYMTRNQVMNYVEHYQYSPMRQQIPGTTTPGMWKGVESIDKITQFKSLKPLKWYQAASGRRWVLTIGSIAAAVIAVFGFLMGAISAIKTSGVTMADLGFGTVHASAVISGWSIENIQNPATQIVAAILVANTPQAILSFLYLNLNGLLTSMFLALEWSHFATVRKALRVSTPKALQRSTHFLQLPYKIAIPLMTVSGVLHWLVSQSVFLAVIAEYDALGNLVNPTIIASCGFSPIAMIVVLIMGVLLIAGAIAVGRFKYNPSMPLAGSCSIAISAACHRPDWDVDAGVLPVQWGVIPGSDEATGIGHCCFTSGSVEPVQEGKQYAGIKHTQSHES